MEEVNPENVIILAGGNDLPTKNDNPRPVEEIIYTGNACKLYGARNSFISSVIIRKTPYMAKRCRELNIVLKGLCITYGYNFIENYNIKYEDLASDGVHLNEPVRQHQTCQ